MLYSFPWLNKILLYGYITSYLFIYWIMGTWCVSTFWLLWIKVLWTFMYKFLCGHTSSFLLGMYLGGELLDHMINLCLTIWGTSRQFSPVVSPLCVLTSNVSGSQFQQGPTSSPTFVIICLKFFFFWLRVSAFGISVPNQGSNVGQGSESLESQSLDHQGTPYYLTFWWQPEQVAVNW